MELIVTILGTGTSQGVPVIGCDCAVCRSPDPMDQRLRTAALLSANDTHIAIDCGPDFRQQMLRTGISKLDAILITHDHNDHIIGLDDVRPFNFMQWQDMPVYATPSTQASLRHRFTYIFDVKNRYPGAPMVKLIGLNKDRPFTVAKLPITPIEVIHGRMPVMGFRTGNFAYITDMKHISAPEFEKLKGVTHLVVNALHHKEHHSHMNLEQALEFVERVSPQQAYLTHISHRMGIAKEVNARLPANVALAYDGLQIKI